MYLAKYSQNFILLLLLGPLKGFTGPIYGFMTSFSLLTLKKILEKIEIFDRKARLETPHQGLYKTWLKVSTPSYNKMTYRATTSSDSFWLQVKPTEQVVFQVRWFCCVVFIYGDYSCSLSYYLHLYKVHNRHGAEGGEGPKIGQFF